MYSHNFSIPFTPICKHGQPKIPSTPQFPLLQQLIPCKEILVHASLQYYYMYLLHNSLLITSTGQNYLHTCPFLWSTQVNEPLSWPIQAKISLSNSFSFHSAPQTWSFLESTQIKELLNALPGSNIPLQPSVFPPFTSTLGLFINQGKNLPFQFIAFPACTSTLSLRMTCPGQWAFQSHAQLKCIPLSNSLPFQPIPAY